MLPPTHFGLKRGFTLIELLIVVAIIAILAAIAVPNFLEAQVRSKVSRARADMRTIATALESYRIDYNAYPIFSLNPTFGVPGGPNATNPDNCIRGTGGGLTTPVAYITSVPSDPFGPVKRDDDFTFGGGATLTDSYYYNIQRWFVCRNFPWLVFPAGDNGNTAQWVLQTKGPDLYFSKSAQTSIPGAEEIDRPYRWAYDPTNGTVSAGNIVRSGP